MTDVADVQGLPEDWLNHPQVRGLLDRLKELEAMVNGFEEKLLAIKPNLDRVRTEKADYLKAINAELARYDNELRALQHMESEVKKEMYSVSSMKETLQKELVSTIDGLEAQAKFAEVEQRWTMIMEDNDWLWVEAIREFQRQAAYFAASAVERDLHGVLIADQMGLGKTLEATAAIDLIQNEDDYEQTFFDRTDGAVDKDGAEMYSVLWIGPNSIKHTTAMEIAKWSDRRTAKLEGPPGVRGAMVDLAYDNGLTLICSYEQLRFRGENPDGSPKPVTPELDRAWPIVILDEAHKFKSESSSTFQMVERICKKAGLVIPMTGTPIMNRPSELWAILHMLTLKGKYKDKFKDSWRFQNEYLSYYGTVDFDRLIKNVQDSIIRRRKDEVEIQLPDKVREVRFVELGADQRELYDMMRDKLYVWLDEQKSDGIAVTNFLAQLTRLRQIALLPSGVKVDRNGVEVSLDCNDGAKLDEALEVITELLDNDEKCLIFSNFNEPLFELKRRIDALDTTWGGPDNEHPVYCDMIIGTSPYNKSERRAQVQTDFNDPFNNTRVVLGNTAAMGLGLNLQGACSNAVFLDLGWNPAVNEQAEDRLHRTGQKSSVTVHIIQAERTVDAFIAQLLDDKANMIEGIMERSELRKALDEGLI